MLRVGDWLRLRSTGETDVAGLLRIRPEETTAFPGLAGKGGRSPNCELFPVPVDRSIGVTVVGRGGGGLPE